MEDDSCTEREYITLETRQGLRNSSVLEWNTCKWILISYNAICKSLVEVKAQCGLCNWSFSPNWQLHNFMNWCTVSYQSNYGPEFKLGSDTIRFVNSDFENLQGLSPGVQCIKNSIKILFQSTVIFSPIFTRFIFLIHSELFQRTAQNLSLHSFLQITLSCSIDRRQDVGDPVRIVHWIVEA